MSVKMQVPFSSFSDVVVKLYLFYLLKMIVVALAPLKYYTQ